MEQRGLITARGAVDILDDERAVGDQMLDAILRDRGGLRRPGVGTIGPDRGEVALAAAGRDR